MPITDSTLPCVLAGPILRRVQARSITLWLATSRAQRVRVDLMFDGRPSLSIDPAVQTFQAGTRLHYLLMELHLDEDLPAGHWTGYRVWLADVTEPPTIAAPWIEATDASLCYAGRSTPGFVYQPRLRAVLHGSCRKPHHTEGDGLVRADSHMACLAVSEPDETWPAALVLTGDQVYCDDVAGPMLRAIHALVARLGLPDEALPGAEVTGTHALHRDGANYYNRASLLPQGKAGSRVVDLFFGGVRKPVFTTDNAENHLVSLAEVLAMYLLVWSPVCWQGLDLSPPPGLSPASGARYVHERQAIESFVAGLAAVRRVLAHVPTAMIFDDHDITDDWNLNREWEEAAYGHDFSRRIIGNALIGYLVHQAWGNDPQAFDTAWMGKLRDVLQGPGGGLHDSLIDELLHWRVWHYSWPTTPPLMVTDGRTHRWRSEVSPRRPSGLMDWEALTDLQQALRGHDAVVLVTSAPIFGVKFIEALQRAASFWGQPLAVDAENWMSHPGAASAILNIFRHPRTPKTLVVLSGDVHYSFVYDVVLRPRGRRPAEGPKVWQICSSGLRNSFPERLLPVLDHLNRWLYSPRSPLNRFTRRRAMLVTPRKPEGTPKGRRLLNGSGVGLVELDGGGRPVRIRQLLANGRDVDFVPRGDEARED